MIVSRRSGQRQSDSNFQNGTHVSAKTSAFFGENDISPSCSDISGSENDISRSCCDISLSENDISLRANDNSRRAQRYIATVRTIASRYIVSIKISFKYRRLLAIIAIFVDYRRLSLSLLLHNTVVTN